jgi:hypothetical protein
MKRLIILIAVIGCIFLLARAGLIKTVSSRMGKPLPVVVDIYEELSGDAKIIVPSNMIIINGLVWNTDTPQAIINNRVMGKGNTIKHVKVGTDFEDIEVVDINDTGIILNYSKGILSIPMRDKNTGDYYKFSNVSFDDYGNYLISHMKYTQNIAQKVGQIFKNIF